MTTATNPRTGEKVELKDGKWVPLQAEKDLSFGDKALGAVRSFVEGQTLGFADEAGLGVAALAAKTNPVAKWANQTPLSLFTDKLKLDDTPVKESFSDIYKQMRPAYNKQQGEFERQNPKTALAGNVAGGLLTGGLGAKQALGTQLAKANPLKAASMFGGVTGGVAGSGFAPTMEDVPTYAGIGALAGAALPPLFSGIGKVLSPVASAAKKALTLQSPQSTAAKTVSKFISADDMPIDKLSQQAQRLGPQATITDVGGENILGAARAVGQLPGAGKDVAKKMFAGRQEGSFNRLMGSLKKLSGGDTNYFQNMKGIISKNLKESSPHYKEAEKQVINVTDDLAELMSRPSAKSAISKGARKAADEGLTIPKNIKSGDSINFRTFDYAKRALDDKIGVAIRQGNGDDARILIGLKNQLLGIADDQIPAYKTARSIYSEGAGNKNAMELGKRILRDDFDEMSFLVQGMSKTEKESFINGSLKTIRDKLMTGKGDKNAATKLATQLTRERLKTVFPDDEAYKSFIGQLDIEDEFARTYQTIYGGSQTQPRQIGQQGLVSAIKGDDVIEGGDAPSIIMNAIKKITGKDDIPQPVVDELQRILFTPAKQLTKKDWASLRKNGISNKQAKEIKGLIPTTLGLTAVQAGASR